MHPGVANGLRARGFEVTTAGSARMLGATDEAHLAFARREGRVLVTHDSDYLILHAGGARHTGIAYAGAGRHGVGQLISVLALIGEVLAPEEMIDHVEFL